MRNTHTSSPFCQGLQGAAYLTSSTVYLKAAEARLAHTKGLEALDTAIHAVELYMKAAEEAPTKIEVIRLRRKLQLLFTYAERLKKSIEPRLLSEHQILRDASKLCGNHFPPWHTEPLDEEFTRARSGELFT